jgi:hypothetical protein
VITGLVFRSSLGVTEWEWHRLAGRRDVRSRSR